jgi:hypothetical protein
MHNPKEHSIYFTLESHVGGGMSDCVRKFLHIFHTITDLTGLPFVYTPFKYAHIGSEYHAAVDKYLGFTYGHQNITEIAGLNYKHTPLNLTALLKESAGEKEYIKKFFRTEKNIVYHIFIKDFHGESGTVLLANELLLKHNFKRLQERKLPSFAHPNAANYRSSLKQKSLFGRGGTKLFFNYRMGDLSILKLEPNLYYDYSRDSFYKSKEDALQDRKWPYRDPIELLPTIKKYSNMHPGAQSILVTDGYTWISKNRPKLAPYLKGRDPIAFFKKESKKHLNEILPLFNLEPFIGDSDQSLDSLFITLQTMMDADEVIGCPGQASTFTKLHSYCL